jgi:hypothetical protein
VLIRKHAEVVVSDEVVLSEFQKHCRVIFVSRQILKLVIWYF